MKKINLNQERVLEEINLMQSNLKQLDFLKTKHYNNKDTMLVVVDMINGFVTEGPFANPRANDVIPKIQKLIKAIPAAKLAFIQDKHTINSNEFKSYPIHALQDTSESEFIKELEEFITKDTLIIGKNSTNTFFSPAFAQHLSETFYKNIIIVGLCSDICVSSVAMSLKQYFNQWNISTQVIVPMDCTETFDSVGHYGDLMNLFTINQLTSNGIKVVKEFK